MTYPSVPKDPGQVPVSSLYIPGTGWVALQGANSSTDGSGNVSAGIVAALYGKNTNPGDTAVLVDSAGRVLTSLAQVGGSAVATAATGVMKVGLTDGTGTALTSTSAALDVNLKAAGTTVALDGSGNVGVNVIGALPAGSALIGKVNIQAAGNSLAADQTNELRVSLYGKATAVGDTAVLLDSSGRLLIGLNQVGGTSVSTGAGVSGAGIPRVTVANDSFSTASPNITIDTIRQYILAGQGYSCSTGLVSAAATEAGQWFATSSTTKNFLIYSVRVTYTNANQYLQFMYLTASDSVITSGGTAVTSSALNLKTGGAASSGNWTMTYNTAATATGTPIDFIATSLQTTVECVTANSFLYLPSGTAGGVATYCNTTAAGKWGMTVHWIEI